MDRLNPLSLTILYTVHAFSLMKDQLLIKHRRAAKTSVQSESFARANAHLGRYHPADRLGSLTVSWGKKGNGTKVPPIEISGKSPNLFP